MLGVFGLSNKLNFKHGTIVFMSSSLLFIITNILMQFLRISKNRDNALELIPYVISGYLAIFIPVIIIIFIKKVNLKSTFRLNILPFKELLMCFALFFCSYFVTMFLSIFTRVILKLFNREYVSQNIPVPSSKGELIASLIIITIIPAFFEDMFFRGFMLSACKNRGIKFSAVCTGLAFSLLHFNLYIFLPILYIGIIFAFAVHYTNSVWAGVFMHFCHNATGVVLMYIVSSYSSETLRKAAEKGQTDISLNTMTVQLVVLGFMAAGAFIVSLLILDKMKTRGQKRSYNAQEECEKEYPLYKIFNIPMCVVIFVYCTFPYTVKMIVRALLK